MRTQEVVKSITSDGYYLYDSTIYIMYIDSAHKVGDIVQSDNSHYRIVDK